MRAGLESSRRLFYQLRSKPCELISEDGSDASLPGLALLGCDGVVIRSARVRAQETPSSYDQIAPVLQGKESFEAVMSRDKAGKDAVMARQKKLLEERYDLTPRPNGKSDDVSR